jgi:CRP/FNR family cyclic AMP-dependent transcriptional regulator
LINQLNTKKERSSSQKVSQVVFSISSQMARFDRLIPISVARSKDFIGELSIFNDEPRSVSAVATAPTTVIMIKKSDIRKVIKECPDWVSSIMITLSDRLRGSIDMLREHRIVDDITDSGGDIEPQEEKKFKNAIDDYRKRRGLK